MSQDSGLVTHVGVLMLFVVVTSEIKLYFSSSAVHDKIASAHAGLGSHAATTGNDS